MNKVLGKTKTKNNDEHIIMTKLSYEIHVL